jgi:hypothetical protein
MGLHVSPLRHVLLHQSRAIRLEHDVLKDAPMRLSQTSQTKLMTAPLVYLLVFISRLKVVSSHQLYRLLPLADTPRSLFHANICSRTIFDKWQSKVRCCTVSGWILRIACKWGRVSIHWLPRYHPWGSCHEASTKQRTYTYPRDLLISWVAHLVTFSLSVMFDHVCTWMEYYFCLYVQAYILLS